MTENDINLVAKFGGTSTAQPNIMAEKIAYPGNEADLMVVSAPAGLTDQLTAYGARLRRTQEEAESIQARLADFASTCDPDGASQDIQAVVGGALTDMNRWMDDGAPIEGLGEYWTARIAAAYIGREFIDARHVVRFGRDDQLDWNATRLSARRELSDGGQYVVPGFYGADADGRIHLLDRNGSDTSAALLASVLDADRLDIWSDVSGFKTADPKIVPESLPVSEMTGREAREMYPGCSLLHRDVIRFTGRSGMTVHMRDTFGEPDNVGTIVRSSRGNVAEMPIVGVVGMGALFQLSLNRFGSEEQAGTLTEVFDMLGRNGIPIEDISSHVDGLSLTFQDKHREKLQMYRGMLEDVHSNGWQAAIKPIHAVRIVGEGFDQAGNERTRLLNRATSALAMAGADVSNPNGGGAARTFFLEDEDISAIVNAVHAELFDN